MSPDHLNPPVFSLRSGEPIVAPGAGLPVGALPPRLASGPLDTRRALGSNEVTCLAKLLPQHWGDRAWRTVGPQLALYAGLHASEIAQLRTDDLRWRGPRAWLTVRTAQQGRRPGHARTVPVHPDLLALQLPSLFSHTYFRHNADGALFPELANAHRPGDAIDSWLRRATRVMADEGLHAPTMRDLRATYALNALEGGASLKAVEAFLGCDGEVEVSATVSANEEASRARDALKVEAVHAISYDIAWHPAGATLGTAVTMSSRGH